MDFARLLMFVFSIMAVTGLTKSHARSIGFFDSTTQSYKVKTHFIFTGPATERTNLNLALTRLSNLWNRANSTIKYKGKRVPIQFLFEREEWRYGKEHLLIQKIRPANIHDVPIIKNTAEKDRLFMTLSKLPELNLMSVVDRVMGSLQSSYMECGGQRGALLTLDRIEDSTTFAHEFGHALGMPHVAGAVCETDEPSIMCPRGSITLKKNQYNPKAQPGDHTQGGTLNPDTRKVTQFDIDQIRLEEAFEWNNGIAVLGPHRQMDCRVTLEVPHPKITIPNMIEYPNFEGNYVE